MIKIKLVDTQNPLKILLLVKVAAAAPTLIAAPPQIAATAALTAVVPSIILAKMAPIEI